MNISKPHTCNCTKVSRCNIFTHPSKDVQMALNVIMDAMATFDDETNSKSILIFKSVYPNGTFTSISKQSKNKKAGTS